MTDQTIDDVSGVIDDEARPVPAIVMVASGTQPAALVLPPHAELGRRIAAAGRTHEVDDERMSRDHATVRWERGTWTIADLDSRNGTYVDGERVAGEVKRGGDVVVRLGHTIFLLLGDGRGHPAALVPNEPIVGPELARVYDQIERHAKADTLLLHGESGSGKELAARMYHDRGPRKAGPFVAVNCAAIPEGVAERLLFGAKKGAFSGAIEALGHFQMADGGTLFLDEIAELDEKVQGKLLRVLEERVVVPMGASVGAKLDLGIVAASHRELRSAVASDRFRSDLYFRLARATVHLPPLRQRKVDLARLVQREAGRGVHAKLVETCLLRPWPGNIRELRAAIRHATGEAEAAGRDVVRVEDLGVTAGMPIGSTSGETQVERKPISPAELDRDAVVAALAQANGVISVAARNLGLHRNQLYRLMEKHGIAKEP